MTSINKIGKAIIWILFFVTFNILTDILLFDREIAPRHFGTAILGGVGGGLTLFFLSNDKKRRNAKLSSDLGPQH